MNDDEFRSFNQDVIREFRSGGAQVAPEGGHPILLLTTVGARSGRSVTSPLAYAVDGDRVFVVASKAGSVSDPAWLHNARAHPQVIVEIGTGTFEAQAAVVEGNDRDRMFARIAAQIPVLVRYQAATERPFSILALDGVPIPRP